MANMHNNTIENGDSNFALPQTDSSLQESLLHTASQYNHVILYTWIIHFTRVSISLSLMSSVLQSGQTVVT